MLEMINCGGLESTVGWLCAFHTPVFGNTFPPCCGSVIPSVKLSPTILLGKGWLGWKNRFSPHYFEEKICANGTLKDKSPVEEESRRIICFWERVKTSQLLLKDVENDEMWQWSSECLAHVFNAGAELCVIGAGILR